MTWITTPTVKYKATVIAGITEFQAEGRYTDLDITWLESHFEDYVTDLLSRQQKPLDEDRVAETIFWIMDDEAYVGRISLRHELNANLRRFGGHIGYEVRPSRRKEGHGTRALALVLYKARELGLKEVMLTCDTTNYGSRKIIEGNGGILEDILQLEDHAVPTMRWWIKL